MEQIDIVWDSVVDFYTKYLDLDGPNSSFVFQLLYRMCILVIVVHC